MIAEHTIHKQCQQDKPRMLDKPSKTNKSNMFDPKIPPRGLSLTMVTPKLTQNEFANNIPPIPPRNDPKVTPGTPNESQNDILIAIIPRRNCLGVWRGKAGVEIPHCTSRCPTQVFRLMFALQPKPPKRSAGTSTNENSCSCPTSSLTTLE